MSIDSGVVENRELGVSYRESYEPLSKDKQDEMGISRIRRKEVIKAPEKFWKTGWTIDFQPQYHWLTEGSFPSFSTWNHAMWGNGGIDRTYYNGRVAWREWLEDGSYFQRIGGNKRGRSMVRKYHDNGGVFNLAMLVSGDSCWRDSEDCPVFVFGEKNKAFQRYLKQIEDSEEAQTMLRHAGWSFAPELVLSEGITPEYPSHGSEWRKNNFRERWVVQDTHLVYNFLENREHVLSDFERGILQEKMEKIAREDYSETPLAKLNWGLLGNKDQAINILKSRKPLERNDGNTLDEEVLNVELLVPMYLEVGRRDDATRLLSKCLSMGRGINLSYGDALDKIKNILERESIEKAIKTYHQECEQRGYLKYIRETAPTFEEAYKMIWPYHFDKLKFLAQGVPSTHDLREVTIPAVDHPEIKPLRWCHSDVGMIKNDNGNLEVLFFE